MNNLFNDIPAALPEELTTTLLQQSGLRVERIVSQGQSSPDNFWYQQDEHEWVLLLSGSAGIHFETDGRLEILKPGDYLHIDAGVRHRVEWTDGDCQSVWLCIFYGVQEYGDR